MDVSTAWNVLSVASGVGGAALCGAAGFFVLPKFRAGRVAHHLSVLAINPLVGAVVGGFIGYAAFTKLVPEPVAAAVFEDCARKTPKGQPIVLKQGADGRFKCSPEP